MAFPRVLIIGYLSKPYSSLSNVLHPEHDMGHDGSPNDGYVSGQFGRHQHVARDAVAYSLSYYTGDYTPINKRHLKQNYLEASMAASAFGAAVPDLWNACPSEA